MRNLLVKSAMTCAAVLLCSAALAQQPTAPAPAPAAPPPPMMYGPAVTLEMAKKAAAAAAAEAKKNNWYMAIAVVTIGGYLTYFEKLDGTQLASVKIAEHKARVAATFRRPTKVFQDGLAAGNTFLLTLDDVIASEGGIPLVVDGKIVGGIGCSGGTGAQDGQVCQAGANALK
jgi:glc operon protein GlcG